MPVGKTACLPLPLRCSHNCASLHRLSAAPPRCPQRRLLAGQPVRAGKEGDERPDRQAEGPGLSDMRGQGSWVPRVQLAQPAAPLFRHVRSVFDAPRQTSAVTPCKAWDQWAAAWACSALLPTPPARCRCATQAGAPRQGGPAASAAAVDTSPRFQINSALLSQALAQSFLPATALQTPPS